ncbi:unnamed protein product [Sphagnum jensenii]|uniref:Uncharacterized protein n=1 Tax=Sphagnum jensenii TaxID=128206 RepID=A0ABP0XE79_9BRYO
MLQLRFTCMLVSLPCSVFMKKGRLNISAVEIQFVEGRIRVCGGDGEQVGAIQAGAQDAVRSLFSEESDQRSLQHAAQRMGKEALQWGLVAGMYTGITYATTEARGVHDWKNALLGGALTGAALSLTEPNPRTDHIISGAITGGAIATAAEFLRNLTY